MHSQDRRCGRGSCEDGHPDETRGNHEGFAVGADPVYRNTVYRTL